MPHGRCCGKISLSLIIPNKKLARFSAELFAVFSNELTINFVCDNLAKNHGVFHSNCHNTTSTKKSSRVTARRVPPSVSCPLGVGGGGWVVPLSWGVPPILSCIFLPPSLVDRQIENNTSRRTRAGKCVIKMMDAKGGRIKFAFLGFPCPAGSATVMSNCY